MLLGAACASALIGASAASAQDAQTRELIVTARKRQESILNVPVIETAIPQAQLERYQVVDLQDVAKLVPGLSFGQSFAAEGTQVSLRGVGTSTLDPGVDQSVSLNIDGLQLSQGLAYQSALFDLGQVEVLKGPQALFYGKSSPGGVISLRTADPTDRFEVIGRAGHEFEAQENRGELIVSGPVTDTLKLRLAAMYAHQEGFFTNAAVAAPGTGARDPVSRSVTPSKDYVIRGTALWNPSDKLDARVKLNLARDRTLYAASVQYTSCPDGVGAPFGIPFMGGEDCKVDRTLRIVDMDPAFFPRVENNGTPFVDTTQTFGTVELNYHPTRDLTVTSETGYYRLVSDSLLNTSSTTSAAPLLSFAHNFRRHDFTEELRVNSDFAGPVNFTAGGFYQDGRFSNLITLRGDAAYGLPPIGAQGLHDVSINSKSIFGQARWRIIPDLELAAGARWTDETRSDSPVDFTTGVAIPVAIAVPRIKSKNTSPELTLTWRPTDALTVFGALKRGYKSGSFNVAAPVAPGDDNAFGDEKVEGGELGLKSRLLERRLAVDLALYDYRYTGLQVGANKQSADATTVVSQTVNAGSALVYGLDFDASYRPAQIEGLGLHLAANWNHARFKTLTNVPCWGGQTVAEGCSEVEVNGVFNAQNLNGTPLVRAPDWQVNFGFDYETPIGDGLTLAFSNSNQYSSKYLANLGNRPDFYQKGFIKADVSIALKGPNNHWEFALIGKNLNNRLTSGECPAFNAAAGLIGGENTGTTTRGPAGIDEVGCIFDRGREVWLRLTIRPLGS